MTRLNTEEMTKAFYKAFPTVVTLEDAMRQALKAADEIERLRTLLDNALERENKDNVRQLQIVRKVEADRDTWKRTCTKLVGMMLPFSLLMNKTEQEELQIILREAVER